MEYYSALEKNTFESVLMRWMNLEPIIKSEVSQKEKDKYCILTYIYTYIYIHIHTESRKMVLKNLFTGQQWRTDMENRLMDIERGRKRVRCMERVTWKLTLLYVK